MQVSPKYDISGFHLSLLQAISRNTTAFLGVIEKETKKFVYVNKGGLQMFDFPDPDISMEQLDLSFLQPLTESEIDDIFQEVLKKGNWHCEMEFITHTGNDFWGKIDISPFTFEKKDFFFIHIELTERSKTAEVKLAGERRMSGAFIDYASIGIVIANMRGKIVRINPFALQLFEYQEHEVIGREIEMLIPPPFRDKHSDHRNRFVDRPQNRPMGTGMDLYAVRKGGQQFPVEVSLGTYTIEEEKFVIAFVNDITIRKNAELEIKKLNDGLEYKVAERTRQLTNVLKQLEQSESDLKNLLEREKELGELKSRFVSMASHEFRTPLSTILSSAYLVEKYDSAESQPKRVKHIERIISSVTMLTDILNDFLSVGKIEEGKIVVRAATFNLQEVIHQVIGDISNLLKPGQVIDYSHKGNEKVTSDLSLLKHIMINLIVNAVKFSPELTQIKVTTETVADHFILKVRDQGIGIAQDDLEHLFERFYRGANAVHIQGTGLGLHIVARYIELLGGSILCDSELGKGTLFIVKVPLMPSTELVEEPETKN